MTAAPTGPLTALAGRVLDHVQEWALAPTDAQVRAGGAALFEEIHLDETIRSIENQITALHGPSAFNHYRGWLLDEACERVGVTVVDGELCTVRSHVFLISLHGHAAVLENDDLVAELAEDLLTSFETEDDVPETITFLPHAYTVGDLAQIGPREIRDILTRSLAAFKGDAEHDWADLDLRRGGASWHRASPILAIGERALIGISHAVIDTSDTGAIDRLREPARAQAWERYVNAPTADGLLTIGATLTWTTTIIGLALQRLQAGFGAEASIQGHRIDNPLLHYAPADGATVCAWLENGPELYGPVRIPAAAALTCEPTFQAYSAAVAPHYIRYPDASFLPSKATESSRKPQ